MNAKQNKFILNKIIKEIFYKILQILRVTYLNYTKDTYISSLEASCKARYAKKVSIGRHTTITSDVEIGYASYVNEWSWIENCIIGNYCSISDHVLIGPVEHEINNPLSHPILPNKKREKIVIGNDVLISHGCTILDGVHIGDGAVIAAGAVVTRNVRPYTVVGGVPARKIRMRFSEPQIELIQSMHLYEKKEHEIIAMCENIDWYK